jgi:hypothetical protein
VCRRNNGEAVAVGFPQQQFVREVAALLRLWSGDAPIHEREIGRLVEWAAVAATRGSAAEPLRAVARRRGGSVAGEARSCLGELFSRQGADSELGMALQDALRQDDAAVVAEFTAIVNRSVRQRLYKQWREDDAAGFNLWRLLRSALHGDPRLLVFPSGDPVWTTVVRGDGLCPDGQAVTAAIVLGHFLELSSRRLSLADMVVEVLQRIADTPGLCRAVRIDVLFAAMRDAAARDATVELGPGDGAVERDPQFRLAVDRSRRRSGECVIDIVQRYSADHKLDPTLATVFERSAAALVRDYAETGIWPDGYVEYLQQTQAEFDKALYTGQLKARFEYLAKCAKQAFEEAMRREYGSP